MQHVLMWAHYATATPPSRWQGPAWIRGADNADYARRTRELVVAAPVAGNGAVPRLRGGCCRCDCDPIGVSTAAFGPAVDRPPDLAGTRLALSRGGRAAS